ncbi:MAG: TonB family protein [Elusimicrobia bacterium]|nr:MAG: TonB family protein [Elusimicrobiota bacterium]
MTPMLRRENELILRRALVASAIAHGLLLWGAPPHPGPPEGARPLAVRLVQEALPPRVPAETSTLPVMRKAVPVQETLKPVRSKTDAREIGPAPTLRAAETAPAVYTAAVTPAETARVTPESEAVAQPTARPPEPDQDTVKELRLALARELRGQHPYPALARERGWTGTVEVVLVYAPGTTFPAVSLGRSSGHAILDRQAMDTVAKAAARVSLPQRLRGDALTVAVPVNYSLEQ